MIRLLNELPQPRDEQVDEGAHARSLPAPHEQDGPDRRPPVDGPPEPSGQTRDQGEQDRREPGGRVRTDLEDLLVGRRDALTVDVGH